MLGRSKHAAQLEASIAAQEATAGTCDEQAAKDIADADALEAGTDAIFTKLAAGELSDAEAETAFDTASEKARLMRVHAGVQTRTAAAHRESVQRSRDRLAAQLYDEACATAEAAAGPVKIESEVVARAVATIVGHSAKLRRARGTLQEAVDAAYRLRPDGAPEPAVADEPDWTGLPEALELLGEGPARPAAAAKRGAEKAQATKERGERDTIANEVTRWGGKLVSDEALERAITLDEPLRSRTLAAIRAEWKRRIGELPAEERARLEAKRALRDGKPELATSLQG
ncbi:MAG TPA: hypothetical protein VIL77_04095 [Gaiellaceae bacterium]